MRSAGNETGGDREKLSGLARRLLGHGLWAFAGRLVMAGSGILLSVLLTRLLVPSEVGAYFLALNVVTAGALAARAGLEKAILQLAGQALGYGEEAQARAVIVRVFWIAGWTVGLLMLLVVMGAGRWVARAVFSSEPMVRIATYMGPWLVYLAFETLLAEAFRGLNDIPRASIYGGAVSRSLCVLCLTLILIGFGHATLRAVVLLTIGCGVLGLVPAALALRSKLSALSAGGSCELATRRLLRTTWPLFVNNLTLFVMGNADLWILGAFRTDEEVALYAVAFRLVLLVGMSLTIVNAILPPLIGELYAQGDRERLERVIRTTASIAFIPSGVALTAFVVVGGPILGVAFGSFYRDAAVVLGLLSLGQLINVGVGSCGYVLLMSGHQRLLMWSAIAGGLLSVIGGLATVSTLGGVGVAGAVVAGVIVQQSLMLWFARERAGVWTHVSPRFLRPALRMALARVRSDR